MTRLDLEVGGGYVEWDENPAAIRLHPTVHGVCWPIEIELRLSWPRDPRVSEEHGDEVVILTGLDYELRLVTAAGTRLAAARGAVTRDRPVRVGAPNVIWLDQAVSVHELARLEVIRDGSPPRFELSVRGSLRRVGTWRREHQDSMPRGFDARLPIEPSREAWVAALREAHVSDAVIVEIPLPIEPADPYAKVHESLLDAREQLDRGGTHGWHACAAAVRQALDDWPGGVGAKPNLDPNMDLESRVGAIRNQLRHMTHLAHHGPPGGWTRADAVLLLSTAAALLARETHIS